MALVEGCKHEVEIVIPAGEMAKEEAKVAETIRTKAHLQGFRPGKAPLSMIQKRYGGEIRQEALDNLLPVYFRKHVEGDKLDIVGQPAITKVDVEPNQDVKFKAEFEVAPVFELGEYRGIAVSYTQPEVTDADVEGRIEDIRKQKAEYINLDPRPAAPGDVAVIDLHSVSGIEGEPIHSHDMQLEIGSPDTIVEFNTAITGMTPGDDTNISITYPENYAEERLAGKTVGFHLELKMLQKKELPEVNNEFAQDLGDFQSVEELKAAVKRSILQDRENAAQRTAKNMIADKLGEMHDFPVPEAFLDAQVKSFVDETLASSGKTPDKNKKIDYGRIKEAMRDRTTKEIRAGLVLDRIGDREAIGATQEDLDAEVTRFAKQHREPVAAVRKRFEENGALGRIANAIRTEKVLNFLFENARKEAPAETPAEPETEAPAESA